MKSTRETSNVERTGIILLTVATALIHFALSVIQGRLDIMFTLNGIGYLVLLAGLYLDLPIARDHRRWVRFLMLGFTAVTILGWLFIGDKSWWLGWTDKLIEVGLVVLLLRKQP